MAPVARALASHHSVLEPLQTAASLEGQVEELKTVLEQNADLPVTLIGFSWGAWLGVIFAARYPAYIKKLIMISSGPFEEKYAAHIQETRLTRLSKKEKAELNSLLKSLHNPECEDKNTAFEQLGSLFSKTDAYDPLPHDSELIDYRIDIFQNVWKDAAEWRKSGKLLALAQQITCPIVAIHGDHDPHPAEGVQKPLAPLLKNFRFILLNKCGHMPWIEREAKDLFFDILIEELQ